MDLNEDEKLVNPSTKELQYNGRIHFSNPLEPILIFPGSSISMSYTGDKISILVMNNHSYNDNYLGYVLDGVQKKVLLSNDNTVQKIMLSDCLESDKKHEISLFKRQDGCHEFTFYGFSISKDGTVNTRSKISRRCIEFYGDSAAAGELIEAKSYEFGPEYKDNGEYSNAWNSYAMMTARNLKAQVSIIAQSGISLLNNSGYFHAPASIGMESIYDKLHYNPDISDITEWDFKGYIPQVVVIDIGQYDAVTEDYMKEDKDGAKAKLWKKHYKEFVLSIRGKYPDALIVLTINIVHHHPSWDRAIGFICQEINDEKIVHFIYSFNGRGLTKYIKLSEAEQMSFELSIFLKGFEPDIWNANKN